MAKSAPVAVYRAIIPRQSGLALRADRHKILDLFDPFPGQTQPLVANDHGAGYPKTLEVLLQRADRNADLGGEPLGAQLAIGQVPVDQSLDHFEALLRSIGDGARHALFVGHKGLSRRAENQFAQLL